MALDTTNFSTGASVLPDAGELSYNGFIFSPLLESKVSGGVVQDEAKRTTKFLEYVIEVDAYVTTADGVNGPLDNPRGAGIGPSMDEMRASLTLHGAPLVYRGRGMDLVVNPAGAQRGAAGVFDVAWGPVPELLEFQPLGAACAAKVKWRVKVRVPEVQGQANARPSPYWRAGLAENMLQFNYETSVDYGEDGYSALNVRGTIEIPLTRTPNQGTRTIAETADDLRGQIDARIMGGIDLAQFRTVRRSILLSRDSRTLTWDYRFEEKPYMDLPPNCTAARGTYSVRPARAGMGLILWLCTLRATYTVRGDMPRRVAWGAFLAMLRMRMSRSTNLGDLSAINAGRQNRPPSPVARANSVVAATAREVLLGPLNPILLSRQQNQAQDRPVADSRRAWLIDFGYEEGLYLDSKTTSFNATWRLVCPFQYILMNSGIWAKVEGNNRALWASTVKDVMGSRSWLANRADPKLDVIVDFGGG